MTVTLHLVDGAVGDLSSLRAWLIGEDELRGRVELVAEPFGLGQMGSASGALTIALGSDSAPGASDVLIGSLIAWIRSRRRDIDITAGRPENGVSVEISAKWVRGVATRDLGEEIERLSRLLDSHSEGHSTDRLPASGLGDSESDGAGSSCQGG